MAMRENFGGWNTNDSFYFAPQTTDQLQTVQAAPLQVEQVVEEAMKGAMQPLISEMVEKMGLQCDQKFKDFIPVMVEAVRLQFAQQFEALIPAMTEEVRLQCAQMVEEVKNIVHSSGLRPLSNETEPSASRTLQLHFVGTLPAELATLNNIQHDGASLMVELRDSSGSRVEVGPESSARIKIVVLDGDFEFEDGDDWREEDFKRSVVEPRKGRGPLLKGDCEISLSKGIAIVHNISFTDNSSCTTKNGHFKFGAQVVKVKGLSPSGIREAVSNHFKVKEHRGQAHKKHETPSLEDDIWRLRNIAHGGEYCKRLVGEQVKKVKDFLQLYHTDEKALQSIVKLRGKKWRETVDHAKSCVLTKECYSYHDDEHGVHLVLDCVFNIIGITWNDQSSQCYKTLSTSQKQLVDRLRREAYEKRGILPKTCDPTKEISVQVEPLYPSNISQMNLPYANAGATGMQPSFEFNASTVLPSQLEKAADQTDNSYLEYFSWDDIDNLASNYFNPQEVASTSRVPELPRRSRVKWNSAVLAVVVKFRTAIKLSVKQSPRALKKRKLDPIQLCHMP